VLRVEPDIRNLHNRRLLLDEEEMIYARLTMLHHPVGGFRNQGLARCEVREKGKNAYFAR
jgi:hypothetical protein